MVIALDISINEKDKEYREALKEKENNSSDEILITLRTLLKKSKAWKT